MTIDFPRGEPRILARTHHGSPARKEGASDEAV
jgi:hypothetical protein